MIIQSKDITLRAFPTNRVLLTVLAPLIGLLALSGCRQGPEGPVTIGTNVWPGYEAGYVAQRHGLYGEAQVNLRQFPSASETLRAFRNRSIDAAAVTLDEALLLAQRGIAIKIVLVTDISNGADAIVAQPGIRSVGDLRGKRVAVEDTALGDYVLGRALQLHGLRDDDVSPVSLTVDETVDAFEGGKAEAVVTFEPFKTAVMKLGGVKIFDSSEIPDEIVDVLIVRAEFAESHPAAVKAVVAGWLRANGMINAQRSDVLREVAARLKITEPELALVLRDLKVPMVDENSNLLAARGGLAGTSKKLIPILERRNHAAFHVVPADLLTTEFLPEAAL